MLNEEKDQEAYDDLTWSIRLTIRLMIFVINILHKQLKPYHLSPAFAIYDLKKMDEEEEYFFVGEDEEEDEGILQ